MSSTATRSTARDHRSADTGDYSVGVAVVHARVARIEHTGWLRRAPLRLFGGGERMIGVDVARGVAVLGLVAGVLLPGAPVAGGAAGAAAGALLGLVTTALFVLVCGVSVSRLLAATDDVASEAGCDGVTDAEHRSHAALGLALRAGLLFALGAGAVAFGAGTGTGTGAGAAAGAVGSGAFDAVMEGAVPLGQPAVMLQLLGALSFLALFLRRWRARSLFTAAGACLLVLPAANALLLLWAGQGVAAGVAAPGLGGAHELVLLFATGAFPVLSWCAPFLAGMAVGRMPQGPLWRPFALLAAGGALFALCIGASIVVDGGLAEESRGRALVGSILTTGGNSTGTATPVAVLGASAAALALLALCLLLARPLRWLLFPLAATGSLALTTSTMLFGTLTLAPRAVATGWSALLGQSLALSPGFGGVAAVAAVLLGVALLATLWRALLGAGPMERLFATLARPTLRAPTALEAADAVAPSPARRATFSVQADEAPARDAEPNVPLPPAPAAPGRVRFSLKQLLPDGETTAREREPAPDEPPAASTPRRVPRQKARGAVREPDPGRPRRGRRRESALAFDRGDATAPAAAVDAPGGPHPTGPAAAGSASKTAPPGRSAPPGSRWNPGQSLGRLPY